MLCASIRRWKFQRSSIGKLPASACCLSSDCTATSTRLAVSTPPSSSRLWPWSAHRRAGVVALSQSTTRPRNANSSASNAPMTAVHKVIAIMYGRRPRVQAHRNGKKRLGGGEGSASG